MDNYKTIIKNYINSYNNFDVDRMLADMDDAVVFENASNGKVNMTLNGIDAFREQAKQALSFFSRRKQTITDFTPIDNGTQIDVTYNAVLAIDLPNGMKKGDELNLTGKSTFTFAGNKIIRLRDES